MNESGYNKVLSDKLVYIVALLVLAVLSLVILGNSVTKPVGRDEHMYCAGGVLMARGKAVYKDFSYPTQLPYHPLLYAVLFESLNTTHYLLVGRLVSVVADIFVMLCIVAVCRLAFDNFAIWGTALGLCAAALYVFNPAVEYSNGHAWNNDVVICCVAISFLLFAKMDVKRKVFPVSVAAIGALSTMAAFMRSTTIIPEMLFFAALLSLPATSVKQRIKTIIPFLAAAGVVLIYPVVVVARSPGAFSVNLFKIHLLNSRWLHHKGIVHDKLELALTHFIHPAYLVLFIISAYLIVVLVGSRGRIRISSGRTALLSISLTAVLFAIALSLPTIWRQYFAPPVPFLLCSFVFPLAWLRELPSKNASTAPIKIAVVLVGVGVLVGWATGMSTSEKLFACFSPDTWVPVQVHETARDIAKNTKEPKLILTLAPLFALEGGCDIYPELSAGAFTYRIGDLMSEANRRITRTAGPEEIRRLVEQAPPSAIIVGAEPPYFSNLEEPLIAVAGDNWKKRVYENGLIVYFRP